MKKVINILEAARKNVVNNINHEMIVAYWNIGKEIVKKKKMDQKELNMENKLLKIYQHT